MSKLNKIRSELPEISQYTYGAMRIGWGPDRVLSDLETIRYAMQQKVWFHASQEYGKGGCFWLLSNAFRQMPELKPKVILKIRCDTASYIRHDVYQAIYTLGIEKVDIVQLCSWNFFDRQIVDDFLNQGPSYQTCLELKERNLVDNFVMEMYPDFSHQGIIAVENDLFDGYLFYLNTLDRYVNRELFELMKETQVPVLALRPLAGGAFFAGGNDPMAPWVDKLKPLKEQTDAKDWVEFNMSYIFSGQLNVKTSIGGTDKIEEVDGYLNAIANSQPLDKEILEQIEKIHDEIPVDMPKEIPYLI